MGDSHAWADIYAWKPHVQLSALLKDNKKAVTYAEHMVNNPKGMLPNHLDAIERRDIIPVRGFPWGTAMHGQTPVHGSPDVRLSALWEPNKHMSIDAKHVVNNLRGTPIMQTGWFERWDRLPMCSFLRETAMHGGHLCMEPPSLAVSLSKQNQLAATHA